MITSSIAGIAVYSGTADILIHLASPHGERVHKRPCFRDKIAIRDMGVPVVQGGHMSIPTELISHARPMTDEEIDRGLERARAASYLAGYLPNEDPHLEDLMRRKLRGEISQDEFNRLVESYVVSECRK